MANTDTANAKLYATQAQVAAAQAKIYADQSQEASGFADAAQESAEQSATSATSAADSALAASAAASSSATSATDSAASAESAATSAISAAEFGDNKLTFADTTAGLAGTTNGQYFRVPQGVGNVLAFRYYKNNSGVAQEVAEYPGQGAISNSIREYATITLAQSDVAAGNILNGSYCWVRNPSDAALSDEYQNASGTLTATGRKTPSTLLVNSILDMISADATSRNSFMQWADKNGLIISKWLDTPDGIEFKSMLLSMGPNGFSAKNAGITASKIFNSFLSIFETSSVENFILSDANGLLLASAIANLIKLPGFTLSLPYLNLYAKKLNLLPGMTLSADGATITLAAPLQVTDQNGLICLLADGKGRVNFSDINKLVSNGSASTGAMTESQVIDLLEGAGAAYAAKRHNLVRFPIPRGPNLKKLTFWLVYGQSYSVGGGSYFAIPDSTDLGNIMLGQSPRGSTFVKGLASYDFTPVGGNVFYPLQEVRQTDAGVISTTSGSHGQTIAKGFADELKRRYNERMRKSTNDTSVIFGVACCGVAGAPIADLAKGAAAGYYNRFLTALSGIATAATAAGYQWEVGGIIYMQGEQDNTTSTEIYLPQLQSMHDNMIQDAMAATGQTSTPMFLINQIGNSFMSGRSFGVVEAQRQFTENNTLAFMVGSYEGLPNPVDHLYANSYRWLGAEFAKLADRVLWNSDEANFQITGSYWTGNTVYVGFSTRVPPLTFKSAYVTYTETMYDDKGFTISDGTGVLTGTSLTVSIVSDNVVKIVAARTLTGTVTVMLGDGTAHAGVHNIADSDSEISSYVWESGLPNQPATENIASLNNKPYSLTNRALIQKVTAKGF